MAKKKASASQAVKPLHKPEEPVKGDKRVIPSMDAEASEKLERLKSLNATLLKEVQFKRSLEAELSQANVEREELRSELINLGETAVRLELERTVLAVFVASQVGVKREDVDRVIRVLEVELMALKVGLGEKESEVSGLSEKLSEIVGKLESERSVLRDISTDRDELKNELDLQVKECKRLESNLSEVGIGKKEIERQLGELQVAYDDVVAEKGELEMRIESVVKEKELTCGSLEEVKKSKVELKEELARVVTEKGVIAGERNVEMAKRKELENVVSGLNKTVAGLQKEEETLCANLAELEKQRDEVEERQMEMSREIEQLVEEKKMSENRIEELVADKTGLEKDLDEAIRQLDLQKAKIEELASEKVVVLEEKVRLDGEVAALQNQVAELRAVISKLEEYNLVEVEKNKSLVSEVGEYRAKLQVVIAERDELGSCVDREKENAEELQHVIEELENKIRESLKTAGRVKAENVEMFAAKSALENECMVLKKRIASLESALNEAQNEFDSVKGKVELADANWELVLNMLKGTAAFCLKGGDDAECGDSVNDKYVNGEAKAYAMELDAIRNGFKGKASKVENMRRQLEEAHKKKSFWTMLSSATSILAVVALAYIVRGH